MSTAKALSAIGGALCLAALASAPLAEQPTAAPATKAWSAWENRMPGVKIEPGKTTLLIFGEVETPHAGVKPVLKRLGPREGEADALELELTLEGETGAAVPSFRSLETLMIVPQHRYKRIYVLHQGAPVAEQPITVRPAY